MDKIIVGFSKPKKWKPFAWLISVGYNIPYNHVYIKFYSKTYDRNLIYQASHVMVNFMAEKIFNEENKVIKEFEVTISTEQRSKMIQFALDNAGKPYGIAEVCGLAIVRIFELFGKTIKNPFSDKDKTYICSELGAFILNEFTDIKLNKDMDDITPKDLYEQLSGL